MKRTLDNFLIMHGCRTVGDMEVMIKQQERSGRGSYMWGAPPYLQCKEWCLKMREELKRLTNGS